MNISTRSMLDARCGTIFPFHGLVYSDDHRFLGLIPTHNEIAFLNLCKKTQNLYEGTYYLSKDMQLSAFNKS